MTAWGVVLRPIEGNDNNDKNKGGVVVVLMDTDEKLEVEVSRVAYVRRHSKNPDVPFEQQLQAEAQKAQLVAEAVNDMLDDFERAQAEELLKSRDRVKELLGPPNRGKLS